MLSIKQVPWVLRNPKKPAVKRNEIEHPEQVAFFRSLTLRYPHIRPICYHPANGGSRNAFEAKKLQSSGVTPGIPDIVIPISRGGYNGLYIELKGPLKSINKKGEPKPSPTPEQINVVNLLRAEGYCAEVCWGYQESWALFENYYHGLVFESCHGKRSVFNEIRGFEI